MGIQFVLDVYACAIQGYIVSYISNGISEILRAACDEARKGHTSIKHATSQRYKEINF